MFFVLYSLSEKTDFVKPFSRFSEIYFYEKPLEICINM